MNSFWGGFYKTAASVLDYGKILKPVAKKAKNAEEAVLDYSKLNAPKVEETATKVIDLTKKSRLQKAKEAREAWIRMNRKRNAQTT